MGEKGSLDMNYINSAITVLGFIVSYFVLNKSFKQEIQKQKTNIYLSELSKIPFIILQMLDSIVNKTKKQDVLISDIRDFSNTILAYGTKESIRISAKMFSNSYTNRSGPEEKRDINETIAIYVLLFCQLKYDLTGIKISPENYYITKLVDYSEELGEGLKLSNNLLVRNLKLDNYLYI